MEPKNQRIEKENHLPSTSIFGFQPLIFQGVVAHSSASKKFRCESFLVFLFWDQKCKAPEFSINKNILPPKKYIISPPQKKYISDINSGMFFSCSNPQVLLPQTTSEFGEGDFGGWRDSKMLQSWWCFKHPNPTSWDDGCLLEFYIPPKKIWTRLNYISFCAFSRVKKCLARFLQRTPGSNHVFKRLYQLLLDQLSLKGWGVFLDQCDGYPPQN